MSPTKIDLGCGNNKRPGFFGLNNIPGEQVDFVIDFETTPLPFLNDSIDHVYSSHAFEHLSDPCYLLQEIIRVCKHDAQVEIWIPYGKSSAAFMYGHRVFLTEMHWRQICWELDRVFLGTAPGYFLWEETRYTLIPGILEKLRSLNISLDFALAHMFDIAWDWGVVLRVKKDANSAPSSQCPARYACTDRETVIEKLP